jgi:putative sterol carrier protein
MIIFRCQERTILHALSNFLAIISLSWKNTTQSAFYKSNAQLSEKINQRRIEMTEKIDYLSPEWREEIEKRLKEEISPEKMKFLTTSVSYIYKNCPDGKDRFLYFKIDDGNFTSIEIDTGESPKAEFNITGDYEVFSKITQGIIKSQRALMSGKLKLRGNMVKALKLASLADRINRVFAQVPTNY